MYQVSRWGEDGNDRYCRVECSRDDCQFVGWSSEPFGPVTTACPPPHNTRVERMIATLEAKWAAHDGATRRRLLADVRVELQQPDVWEPLLHW